MTAKDLTRLREDRAYFKAEAESNMSKAEIVAKRGQNSVNGIEMVDRLTRKAEHAMDEVERLDAEIIALEARMASDSGPAASRRNPLGKAGTPTPVDPNAPHASRTQREAARGTLRGQALTVNEQANTVPDAVRQKMALALEAESDPESKLARYVIATGNQHYARAFRKWMRDPLSGFYEWTAQEREAYAHVQSEARAMSLTGASGGFLVSYELDPQVLISGTGSINPMRDLARVEIVAQNVNKFVTSAGVTASWDAEGAEVSDDTPTLAQPSITCVKGQAFVPLSFEIFEDSPDLPAQIQKLFVDAKAQLEATAFTTGSGSGEPKGIITAIAAVGGSVVTSAGTALAVADAFANQVALPPRWRPNAKFTANLAIINQGRQLPIAGSGALPIPLVDDSTTPPRMLGWEVYENSAMDGTIAAGSTNDYCLLSGDFEQFIIADRIGTSVEFVQNLFGSNQRPTGQRGFLLHWRTGADAVITDAFRLTNYNG